MKKIALIITGLLLAGTTLLSAKNSPTVATQLPTSLKEAINNQMDYPKYSKNNGIEGEVWMKIAVTPESKLKIVELSATHPNLGEYVKEELVDFYIQEGIHFQNSEYYLKVTFNLFK